MHIPDGYLGPSTYTCLWASMIGVWSFASRRLKRDLSTSRIPFLAMASAFCFVAMIFAIPLPGGTTAHITAAPLIAMLLGPWAAVISVSVALIIQALVFGDGGVTAIAANCFNIALVGSCVGYAVYRLVISAGEGIRGAMNSKATAGQPEASLRLQVFAAATGAYLGINAAALCTALELGLQPIIYGGSQAGGGYFPYPLAVAIPAIVIPHLTLIGVIESTVAAMVVGFIRKAQPEALRGTKTCLGIVSAAVLLAISPGAFAHEFMIEPKGLDQVIAFGHGSQRVAFDVSKVKQVRAIDAQGQEVSVRTEKMDKGLALKTDGAAAAFMVEIDNGYWSKTIYGWKELPKRKADRVVESIRSLFYSKAILSWNASVQAASSGARLDIVPRNNPVEARAGETVTLTILLDGKPLPNVQVNGGDHAKLGATNGEGAISFPVKKGVNLLSVEHKERIQGDPDADVLNLNATLSFEVKN